MVRYRGRLSDLVKEEIVAMIEEQNLQSGDQLPSEEQLSKDLNVSRPTVREALQTLEKRGIVTRQQGKGTFVTSFASLQSGLETWSSLSEVIAESGRKPGARVLSLNEGTFGSNIHARLKIAGDEACMRLERVRTADGDPMSYVIDYVPRKRFGDKVVKPEMFSESLVVLLEEEFAVRFEYAMTWLTPLTLDESIAALLEVPANTPALMIEEIHFDDKDQPVFLGIQYFPQQKVKFHIKRYRTKRGQTIQGD
ncbi:MAG: GntR family transcriptional regulator [Firmicutes bacterium]|nr:GntR family transcriptional regulator [Bacillota bacterium]